MAQRGGSRKHPADCSCGHCPRIGRPKREKPTEEPSKRNWAANLVEKLNEPVPDEGDPVEVSSWRPLWESKNEPIKLRTRIYLYDQAKGRAVDTVNHVHDKPIDLNVNLSMAEVIREVRQRKLEYERSRK